MLNDFRNRLEDTGGEGFGVKLNKDFLIKYSYNKLTRRIFYKTLIACFEREFVLLKY